MLESIIMYSWKELDNEFRIIQPSLNNTRLDIQWGAAGEYFRLAAFYDVQAKERFVSLSRIAGNKLIEAFPENDELKVQVLTTNDPVEIWYRTMWHVCRTFEHGNMAIQKSEEGEDMGHIFTGSIRNPAAASAGLCLDLFSKYGEPKSKFSIKGFLESHWKWVIGTIITIVGIIVAL